MSHSKRNTARSVFTSYERDLAKSAWSTNTARLSRDSFLPFASCRLCLLPARTPVSCQHGDIFCRECALSDILAQKKEIKRLERAKAKELEDARETTEREEGEAQKRAVAEFESIQMGLERKGGKQKDSNEAEEDRPVEKRGEKRKFELDEEELLRIAREERTKARITLDSEKASKTTLPSFWVPSVTPTSNTGDTLHKIIKAPKKSPICPASQQNKPHTYSLHTLITVSFSEDKDSEGKPQRVCPACKKMLGNSSKAVLTKPCGHALCGSCVGRFMTKGKADAHASLQEQESVRCYVCETDLTEVGEKDGATEKKKGKGEKEEKIKPGMVEIKSEGTGFASGGMNKVEKFGVAFQC